MCNVLIPKKPSEEIYLKYSTIYQLINKNFAGKLIITLT